MREECSSSGRAGASPPGQPEGRRNGRVEDLAMLINEADSVTFFCGAGSAAGRDALLELAERVQAPMAYTLSAKTALEPDNPFAVGMSGPLGWGDAAHVIQNCDLLVLWGTNFPFRNYLPRHGRVAQVDIDPAALGRRVPICLGLVGDVEQVARRLLPLIRLPRAEEHLHRSRARHGRAVSRMHAQLNLPPEGRVNAAYLTRLVSDLAEPDAVFCLGLGSPLRWGPGYLQAHRRQRLHFPAMAGSLIGELVQARRCKEDEPGRQVIALCDDDMRETLSRELPALWHDGLAVKILLYGRQQEYADELPGGELLEMVAQAPAAVRRWLSSRRASLLEALLPHADAP